EEGTERLVLPGLQVARRPVVEQHGAEHMVEGSADGYRASQPVASAGDEAELGFIVQAPARGIGRCRRVGRLDLTDWAPQRGAGDYDRRAAPVVADRHPFVIGQQWIVRPQQATDVGRMMDARIEVAVIADGHRKEELGLPYRHELPL